MEEIKKILELSEKHNLSHIASSLSCLDILKSIKQNLNSAKIVLGKPHCAQAFSVVFGDSITSSVIYNSKKILYSNETLNSALSFAVGYCHANRDKTVFCICPDSVLQNGQTYEALNALAKLKCTNLITIFDMNNEQVTGRVSDILDVDGVFAMFKNKLKIYTVNGHNTTEISNAIQSISYYPKVILAKTIKGYGVKSIMENPLEWHYKKVTSDNINALIKEII